MAGESSTRRPLFGGAISTTFPVRFQDVSNIREVPDHQEVLVDPARDESLIFELLDLKGEVEDGGSALWFLRDVANEQDAGDNLVMEHSGTVELAGLRLGEAPALAGTAIARLAVSKGRQGREAQNIVRVYLANIRLKNAATDVVITAYDPLLINPLSESAQAVAAGPAVPAEQAGCLPMSECRYMERLEVDGSGTGERDVGAYDDEEEEEDDDLTGGGARGGAGGLGEKKRRLASEQVRALERSFEADNKLDPERKARVARDLLLHPRQVAVWFQNRRARWKTKQIERDFTALRTRHDALRHECDSLRRDKDALAAEIRELREKVKIKQEMAVKLEQQPSSAAAAAVYKQDGSTDSDSSAVLNEEASPYSGAAFDQHNHPPQPSFTGFTSFLGAPSSALTLSSSFPSLYHGLHFDQDDGLLLGATAADELGGAGLFAADQEHAGGLSWYGSQGW